MPPYIRETITRFLDDFRRRSTEITCDGFPSYFIAIPLSAHVSTEQWKPFRAHSSLWAFDRGCTSNYMRQLVSAVVHATKACPIFFFTFLSLFFFSPVHQEIPDSFPPRLSSDTFIVSPQSTFIRGHRRNSAIYPLLSPLMGEGRGEGLSRLSEAKLYFSTGNDGIPRPIPSSRIIN